jgi:hypothetical protein
MGTGTNQGTEKEGRQCFIMCGSGLQSFTLHVLTETAQGT